MPSMSGGEHDVGCVGVERVCTGYYLYGAIREDSLERVSLNRDLEETKEEGDNSG